MPRQFPKISHIKKRAFLAAYSETGNLSESAEIAGIDRRTHYNWLEDDLDYAEAFDIAKEKAADLLEKEARRRAVEGVEKPVFYQGQQCGTVREYSDTLMIVLLKSVRPEKFRENIKQEITGPSGGPQVIKVTFAPLSQQ